MKKLLSLLAATGLVASSTITVVACGNPDDGNNGNGSGGVNI